MQTKEAETQSRSFGKVARTLISIALFLDWAGVAAIMLALFALGPGLMMTLEITHGVTSSIAILSLALTPMIKFISSMLVPVIGRVKLSPWHRRTIGAVLLVSGGLTIPPIVIGGTVVLDPLLDFFGVLPFLPHVVGGSFLLAAGALALLWTPPPIYTPTAFVSVVGQPAPTVVPERAVREVVLVVCPFCGVKNPQGATKCSNCGGRI